MPEHYTYPGSDVLVNKLGITDYKHWKFVETEVIGQRMGELREHPIPGSYDLPHLLAIHRHLTRDLYDWAGERELLRQMHHSSVPHQHSRVKITSVMTP